MREQIIKKADEILKQAETYGPYANYYGYVTAETSDMGVTFRLEMDEALREDLVLEESTKGIEVMYDLLEDFIGNGWEWVAPEEIGVLTDAPIIMDPNDYIYWYSNYMTTSPVEDLIEKGETFFERAE